MGVTTSDCKAGNVIPFNLRPEDKSVLQALVEVAAGVYSAVCLGYALDVGDVVKIQFDSQKIKIVIPS